MKTSSSRGVQPLDGLVVDREVEDGEEVAVVLVVVDLRPLALRDDVLDVQRDASRTARRAPAAVSRSGATALTQVSPAAASSATCGARATSSAPGRGRVLLRMRGRLGTGTERVVGRGHHVRHSSRRRLRAAHAQAAGDRRPADRASGSTRSSATESAAPSARRAPPTRARCRAGSTGSRKPPRAGPSGEADLPRERRQRHVAAEQPRIGEVADERRLHRAVDALADPERRHHDGQEDGGRRRRRQVPPTIETSDPARGPEDAEEREHPHPPVALRELRDRELGEHDDDRVDEEDHARSRSPSPRPRSSRTRGGARSPDMPAKMKSVLSPTTPTNARCRRTSRSCPALATRLSMRAGSGTATRSTPR